MSRWTPDEHGCIYDEAGCFARLTPNKAERLASRHNADIDALTAERDRLAAENAELKAQCQVFHAEAHGHYIACLAANATLEKLREVGIDPGYHGNPADWAVEDRLDTLIQFQSILYPKETTDVDDT